MVKTVKCKKCDYVGRKDNTDRHFKEKHLKMLPACKWCRKKMSAVSLSRHKYVCPLRLIDNNINNKNIGIPATQSTANKNIGSPVHLIGSETYKIETIVRLDTYSDGSTVVVSDEIKVDNINLVLLQKCESSNGKY